MNFIPDPVDRILDAWDLNGPWEPLPATGLANRIYATSDVVIRVAKEHEEALRDARTESIAAPVAFAEGVLTPRLLAFDDSGDVADGPYSIWERVHGETLGLMSCEPKSALNIWRQIGQQMAHLHARVQPFEDPKQYLHEPARNLDLRSLLEELVTAGQIRTDQTKEISRLIDELRPAVLEEANVCFLHGDVKDMNIMCTRGDELLALIDWGDAGWGDPTFDFFQIPLSAIPYVLEGYSEVAPGLLGATLKERIIWDKLERDMSELLKSPACAIPMDEFRRFLGMSETA